MNCLQVRGRHHVRGHVSMWRGGGGGACARPGARSCVEAGVQEGGRASAGLQDLSRGGRELHTASPTHPATHRASPRHPLFPQTYKDELKSSECREKVGPAIGEDYCLRRGLPAAAMSMRAGRRWQPAAGPPCKARPADFEPRASSATP